MTKIKFLLGSLFFILLLVSFGCASSPNVAETTQEEQAIINVGKILADDLGLKPYILTGDQGKGTFLMFRPEQFTNDELIINATQNNVIIGDTVIKPGQFARKIDSKFIIVKGNF